MFLLKSTLLSAAFLFAAPPAEVAPETAVDTEYCYYLTVTIMTPFGGSIDVTAEGCGSTPSAGLFALGEAVRELAQH